MNKILDYYDIKRTTTGFAFSWIMKPPLSEGWYLHMVLSRDLVSHCLGSYSVLEFF